MILDWLYPPTCMGCKVLLPLNDKKQRTHLLCLSCAELLEPITETTCNRCGQPMATPTAKTCNQCRGKTLHFTTNYALFIYEGFIRDIILNIKFRNKKNHAKALGYIWADFLRGKNPFMENAVLCPLPLHKKKQRERGFNQAEVLAAALGKGLNLPVEKALIRTVDTPPQAGLHPAARVENVADAFSVTSGYTVAGKHIIIVDDIYTTGASINECARVLQENGAAQVMCLTLVITLRKEKKHETETE